MRKLLLLLLAGSLTVSAQQGPIVTQQLNSTYFVKQVAGFYPTVQSAVTKACTRTGATVNIPAGSAPADTIAGVTGGCTSVGIVDERAVPAVSYAWSSGHYTALSGGGITALTGPVTGAGTGSVATTITPTVTPGSCLNCDITYNAAGQVTAAATGAVCTPAIFPVVTWDDGTNYAGGDVVLWLGIYYQASIAVLAGVGDPPTHSPPWTLLVRTDAPGTCFEGPWIPTITYNLSNMVASGGVTYISLVASNVGNMPASSPSQWAVIGGSSYPGVTSDGANGLAVTGTVAAGTSVSAPQHCIGSSCITAWPTGGGSAATCPLVNTTNICLTASPYNASGDGATATTTSGTFAVGTSGAVASCSTLLASQGVLIAGAGVSGANYIGAIVSCAGTTLTVTPATSTGVASGHVVQHDETAAFSAAITALSTIGGTIWLPKWGSLAASTYNVYGPLQDTSCANAVLPMPKIPNYSANPIIIGIKGLDTPGGTSAQTGEIIQFGPPSGNFFGGCDTAPGGGFQPITNVKLHLEDLTLSSYTNPAVVAVNATALQGFIGKHLYVNMPSPALPTNAAGGGIFLPAVGNNVQIILEDVQIAGYYTPLKIGEHAHIREAYVSYGVDCFKFDNGTTSAGTYTGNSGQIDYLWTGHCTHGLVGPTSGQPMTVNISLADLETDTADEVYDPSNLLHGIVNFTIPQDNGVPINCIPRVVGGVNLTMNPLQCRSTVTGSPAVGLAQKWLAHEGSGSTFANTGLDSTNSATATAVTWSAAPGFTGPVAHYGGTNSRATAASYTGTNFDGASPFASCQWANPTSYTAAAETLFANVNSTTGVIVYVTGTDIAPGKVSVFLFSTLSNLINVASTFAVVSENSAHLVCVSYAGTKLASGVTIYVDGSTVPTSVITDALAGGSIASSTPITIGAAGVSGSQSFLGAIGPTLIYSRALTSADVAAIYADGSGAF